MASFTNPFEIVVYLHSCMPSNGFNSSFYLVRMKLTSILKAVFAVGAFVAFTSLGSSDAMAQTSQVQCARQLNACKRNCDALKAQAKRTLDQCEANCRASYRNCTATPASCRQTRDA